MVKKKYSKSSSFYLNTKNNFFEKNKFMYNQVIAQNKIYKSQKKRKKCKLCNEKLPYEIDIRNHYVEYIFCNKCSHLNGAFEDTEEFVKALYINDDGEQYSSNYIDENFEQKSKDIYLPKIDFLLENIKKKKIKILDVGCGAGHFVYAGIRRNCDISGIDVGKKLIDFGNNQIMNLINKKNKLNLVNEENIYKEIIESHAQILSVIGVIEHLREPFKLFDAFKKSKIKYIFYSVPMFSLSVLIENVFKNVFPRQLAGGHTHLFTEKSIIRMNKILKIDSFAEWRFGTDILDLFRSINVTLKDNKSSKKTIDYFSNQFYKSIDKMQNIFDKSHFCSEIHVLGVKQKQK